MLRRVLSWIRIALMTVGAWALIVTFTPIVPWTAARLAVDWTESDSGTLILLAGSADVGFRSGSFIGASSYWRAAYAVDAWRAGHFQRLLLSGQGAESIKPILSAYGISEDAIVVENRSVSTRENVLFAKPLLAAMPAPYILLTSDFHTYRASRCFAREKIRVLARPVPDVLKRSTSLELRWECSWTLAKELVKIGYYRTRGWM